MPRHISPTSAKRTATAPYNFVPLPKRIFTVAEGIEVDGARVKPWHKHGEFVPGTYSGWIDLAIETLTPLFIRGPARQDETGTWDSREARLRPEPYTTPKGTPAIPGSSLRGMVRMLVEILSSSKITPVTRTIPFFRSMARDRIGDVYRARMGESGQKPCGGVLVIRQGVDRISPCRVIRVQRSLLKDWDLRFKQSPNYTPPWSHQHKRCWVRVRDGSDEADAIHLGANPPSGPGWHRGTLVLTGYAQGKKREFVFLDGGLGAGSTPEMVEVPRAVWERFHDEAQITKWQEKAFPHNEPDTGSPRRRAAGHLRDGEPVFFVTGAVPSSEDNPHGLFLGRAGMFRLPYDRSPADLIPPELVGAGLDLAEAMFGKVTGDGAIKGRLYFEDAVAVAGGPDWFEALLVPQVLSTPKPTCVQHYLTQNGEEGRDRLTAYFEGDTTTVRGHKVYWHRWEDGGSVAQVKTSENYDALLDDLQRPSPEDSQHTIIRPVRRGVTFNGRIRFENLTDIELGALLEALRLPEGCCHHLGMGKPLGLGSVRITCRLRVVDRAARYRNWRESGVQEGEDGRRFRDAFVHAMLDHARVSGETLLEGQEGLRQIARLDALYRILSWSNRPERNSTAYMPPEEFRDRPVLPTPHAVIGAPEPGWLDDPPRPAPASARSTARRPPKQQSQRRRASRSSPPSTTTPVKPVQKGQTRTGVLHRRKDGWVAVFDGDGREAVIVNPNAIPLDCTDGTTAEFYITEQSKRRGIKARFERIK